MTAREAHEAVASLLADPRMQQACGAHDMGTVLRLVHSRGVSVRRLAEAIGLTPGRVHEYLTGKRQPSGFTLFERISDGLRIPGSMLGLADRPWERRATDDLTRAEVGPTLWIPSRTVDAVSDFTQRDLMLGRRDATKVIATLAVGVPLIEHVERWLGPGEEHRAGADGGPKGTITPDEVARLEQAADVFRAWDDQYGGGLRRKAVVGQLSEVADLLQDSHPPSVSRRLFRVASRLAETAAMMSWDSGQQAKAQNYYLLALRAAKEAGEYAFGANILASMARQVLYMGRPDDALELIRLAGDGSAGRATPTVRSMLYTREAWAYAKMGRVQAFKRATGNAEEEFAKSRPEEDPEWIRYFDAAELAGVTGGRLLELSETDPRNAVEARDQIKRALDQRQSSRGLRSYALDQAGLAHVCLIQREFEEAARVGNSALDTAEQTHSDRVRIQLQDLYQKTVPYSRITAIRDLNDRLRQYLSS